MFVPEKQEIGEWSASSLVSGTLRTEECYNAVLKLTLSLQSHHRTLLSLILPNPSKLTIYSKRIWDFSEDDNRSVGADLS
jgi:hypothetical protein